MVKNRVSLGIDIEDAIREFEALPDAVDDGASDAVKQLAVLAEGSQKEFAPEGAGRDRHLRDSIDTKFRRNGLTANVGARKRASDGTLLAIYIVNGTDADSYDPENPPPPLNDWAEAKLGDASLGWAVAQAIARDGHETLPNPYVDLSMESWEDDVEEIAGDRVREAMSRLMGGA